MNINYNLLTTEEGGGMKGIIFLFIDKCMLLKQRNTNIKLTASLINNVNESFNVIRKVCHG